jgi:hypothetical protein
MRRRFFTVDEANALIPDLEEAFRGMGYFRAKIRDNQRKLEVLSLLWEDRIADPSNPDYTTFLAHKRAIENDVSEIERIIQEEIVRRGLRFPVGGIENGLVDFPSTYEGRWVYLCWQNGEPELLYWHETDAGFRGRQRITDEHKRLMGTDDGGETPDDSALDF